MQPLAIQPGDAYVGKPTATYVCPIQQPAPTASRSLKRSVWAAMGAMAVVGMVLMAAPQTIQRTSSEIASNRASLSSPSTLTAHDDALFEAIKNQIMSGNVLPPKDGMEARRSNLICDNIFTTPIYNACYRCTDNYGPAGGQPGCGSIYPLLSAYADPDSGKIFLTALGGALNPDTTSGVRYITDHEAPPCDVNCHALGGVQVGGDCFYSPDLTASWTEADQWCSNDGGHLAIIRSQEQNEAVFQLYQKKLENNADGSVPGMWFGLHDQRDEGRFDYVRTGRMEDLNLVFTDSSFTNWLEDPLQPNNFEGDQDCVEMYNNASTWNDLNCGEVQPFVCQKKAPQGSEFELCPLVTYVKAFIS